MVDWLAHTKVKNTHNTGILYIKDLIEKSPGISTKLLDCGGLLVLETKKEHWLNFAVMEFFSSDLDGGNDTYSVVFHGSGVPSHLRELRHTYWGEDGYLFYPNLRLIASAFFELKNYFDGD